MPNLKEIRNRISSVSSTMQITNAMKMVSAAKLKKAQDSIVSMRPYSEKISDLIDKLVSFSEETLSNPFFSNINKGKILIITITSNRGLCGAFNSNIVKSTINKVAQLSDKKIDIISIGKVGKEGLSKKFEITKDESTLFDNLTFENTSKIANGIINDFLNNKYNKVFITYNQFKNAATQIVKFETLLPISSTKKLNKEKINNNYIIEPSYNSILETLLPSSIRIKLFKAIKESFASEHGARMTAMHKATDNAKDLRDQLKLTYNKARQASITNEILEIVSGAEALKN
tara:strand:- start:399 stop:1262 length:864 start_codon:yes stop_codon:yes gene_type:complete